MELENLTIEELEKLESIIKEEIAFREEERERLLMEYENDPLICEGWSQQDTINMYRQER